MPTLQQIYVSAKSVENVTGIDPAIITALAATEWGSNTASSPVTSLGIGTASSHGSGTGTAGGNGEAGQPGAFWTYTSGAGASVAFRDYINFQFPKQAPFLGNATQFFNAMKGTNYDVVYNVKGNPSSGRNTAAENQYWDQHIQSAAQYAKQFGGITVDTTNVGDSTGVGSSGAGSSGDSGNGSGGSSGSSASDTSNTSGLGSGDIQLGSVAGQAIGIPSGLVLAALAVVLLLIGAILFLANSQTVKVDAVKGVVNSGAVQTAAKVIP